MKKDLLQVAAKVVVVIFLVGLYLRIEGAIPIAVTQIDKRSTFDVQGEGKVMVKPDVAVVMLGTQKEGRTVKEAVDAMDKTLVGLSEELNSLGIEKKDLKTVNYSVNQNYNNEIGIGEKDSYLASVAVEVKVKDLEKISAVLELIGKLGLTQSGGLNFSLADESLREAQREARELAVKEAKDKAEELAGLAGVKLGRVVNVTENWNGDFQPIGMAASRELKEAVDLAPQVEAGVNEVVVRVTLSYETR